VIDARTRILLEAPITSTLLRLAVPNILVLVAQAAAGLVETHFIGKLGIESLAGVAFVFPVVMLMQMMSGGAMGGGISSAIARALGASRRADANALVVHAVVIALGFGLTFTLAALGAGRWLYGAMGAHGASLNGALTYSKWIFAGAVLIWLFNALASAIRATGNMTLPALVTLSGTAILVPLSPVLIFGWGPIPAMGIAGGAIALLAYYAVGAGVLWAYLCSSKSVLHPSIRGVRFEWRHFRDILRVGAVASLVSLSTNLAIVIGTAQVGVFGTAAIAGYGTGARLEYLLIPLVFGLGAPLVTMVGTSIGAGNRERALRVAWIGAGIAFAITEAIGLAAAVFPHAWLTLFETDPAMLDVGTRYLRILGPCYGMVGLALSLYFASQGAGRLAWPVAGNLVRLTIAAAGGFLALRWSGDLSFVFLAQSIALVAFGLINAVSVAGGAWFGRLDWPATRRSIPHQQRILERNDS